MTPTISPKTVKCNGSTFCVGDKLRRLATGKTYTLVDFGAAVAIVRLDETWMEYMVALSLLGTRWAAVEGAAK